MSDYSKITHKWEQCVIEIQQLQQQLAAEREKPKTTEYAQGWDDHVLAAKAQRETLEEQLAAEKESMIAHARDEVWEEVKQLREQLSADREKVQTLVDALTQLLGLDVPDYGRKLINATLEKYQKVSRNRP